MARITILPTDGGRVGSEPRGVRGESLGRYPLVPSVVGILQDEVDLIVYVMKIEKAPLDSYADNGGLEAQSHDIKEAVELLLTHPEFYANIGIKPPKGVIFYGERRTGKTVLAKVALIIINSIESYCHLLNIMYTEFLILLNHGSLKIINHHAVFKWSHKTETYSQNVPLQGLRYFTNQKSSFHILEHFIRICSYINFSKPRDKQSSSSIAIPSRAWVDLSVPRSIKTMVWSGPKTASEASYTWETKFITLSHCNSIGKGVTYSDEQHLSHCDLKRTSVRDRFHNSLQSFLYCNKFCTIGFFFPYKP
ncbi:hypothetical protein DY000_02041903 [Brassica cretica]|uniref:ATPase AAA-type core domain-containing protein n=1 Tax=Brassica cretica TaxID=69181 RepID=A0ABQ7BF14_BRACR|nr:hypothetical protein DY000_02041903 [Brassica cretica]